MADIAQGADPAALGALRQQDLDAIVAQLAGPNPHPADMDLPPALTQDGGRPS